MNEKTQQHVAKLVGGLAHEIKSPLSTIGMNLQLITEDIEGSMEGETTDREKRVLKKVKLLQKEVSRLEESLNGFLRFVGQRPLDKRPGSINLLLEEILDFVQPEAQARGIRVVRKLDYRIPLFRFDFESVRQAAFNVVKNACEAMKSGGELLVESSQGGGFVAVAVTDDGPSVPQGMRDVIFDPFFSTKPEGSGLGLAVAKQAAENHGGSIEFSAPPRRGSCFTLKLQLDFEQSRKPHLSGGRT